MLLKSAQCLRIDLRRTASVKVREWYPEPAGGREEWNIRSVRGRNGDLAISYHAIRDRAGDVLECSMNAVPEHAESVHGTDPSKEFGSIDASIH